MLNDRTYLLQIFFQAYLWLRQMAKMIKMPKPWLLLIIYFFTKELLTPGIWSLLGRKQCVKDSNLLKSRHLCDIFCTKTWKPYYPWGQFLAINRRGDLVYMTFSFKSTQPNWTVVSGYWRSICLPVTFGTFTHIYRLSKV